MSGAPSKDASQAEIRTGQVLNGVATAGGLHAAYLTGKEIRHTAREGVTPGKHEVPKAPGRLAKVPGVGRIARNPKKAALAALGGWGVLHTGELAGDAIAARSLHRQAQQNKEKAVAKSIAPANQAAVGRRITETAEVAKRNFDPEADRQRRLGTYAGLAGGAAVVAGSQTAGQFEGVREGGKLRGLKVKSGVSRAKAGKLVAATGALSLLGAASYKRGVSERNKPWN